jgi:ribokinase
MSKQLKLVSIGAAAFEILLMGESLRAKRDVRTQEYVEQFPLGEKLEIENLVESTGGNTNAAVTFARYGYDVSYIGKLGDDVGGREVLQMLKNEGINTSRVVVDLVGQTGRSTILLAPTGERVILVYRGVSGELLARELKLDNLDADAVFLSSLSGNFKLLKKVLDWANQTQTKVVYNPSAKELMQPSKLKPLLEKVHILAANRDEFEHLYGQGEVNDYLRQAVQHTPFVLLTDGAKGAWATDGKHNYRAGLYRDVKVVDRTGAGDAFVAGFAAALLAGKALEEALTYASANSTSVVQQVGAKAGILEAGARLKPMKIKVTKL